MPFRPIVRALVVPVLRFSLSGIAPRLPARAEEEEDPNAPPRPKYLNVNQATADELCRLPGVGPKLAERIVYHRQLLGGFRRPEDLMVVGGIAERFYMTLRPYVAVSGPTTLVEKVAARPRSR